MKISKRNFMFLLLSSPSYKALACGGPETYLDDYRKKGGVLGKPLCNSDQPCTFEEFLNKKYGISRWEYNEKFFVQHAQVVENPSVVSVTIGANGDAGLGTPTELTIYIETSYFVVDKSKLPYPPWELPMKAGGGVRALVREEMNIETNITEAARFLFLEPAIIYASTRLNLRADAYANSAKIFAVFNNKNGLVKVVKPPYKISLASCIGYILVK